MSSTITVQNLIDHARSHIKLFPLVGIGTIANEPGLSFANSIKQIIVNQNYNWRWNRLPMVSFLTVDDQDEYPLLANDVGWLEKCRIERDNHARPETTRRNLNVRRVLDQATWKGDPNYIAMERDDNGQTILRIAPIPSSTIWRVYPTYQKEPLRMTALTDTFDPIPDTFENVLKQFFLAFAYELVEKRTYLEKFAMAKTMLDEAKANLEPEENNAMFYPQRSLFIG